MVDELPWDPPLTPEQALIAASLSPELVDKVDAELLSHARPYPHYSRVQSELTAQ